MHQRRHDAGRQPGLSHGGLPGLCGRQLAVLLLVVLLSKRAVGPVAESYQRQRQFVTDASHELKTPLTLLQANLDILESEAGENPGFLT